MLCLCAGMDASGILDHNLYQDYCIVIYSFLCRGPEVTGVRCRHCGWVSAGIRVPVELFHLCKPVFANCHAGFNWMYGMLLLL